MQDGLERKNGGPDPRNGKQAETLGRKATGLNSEETREKAAVLPKGRDTKMWFTDLIRQKRWFIFSLFSAIAVPGLVLVTLSHFAEELSEEDALAVAAIAVKNYVDENPPANGWRTTDIHVTDDQRLVVDIHVPVFEHAQVIKSRNKRIRYSYLKLACPPSNAWVYEWFGGGDRIWIKLHHHGDEILEAPCPKVDSKSFYSEKPASRLRRSATKRVQIPLDG